MMNINFPTRRTKKDTHNRKPMNRRCQSEDAIGVWRRGCIGRGVVIGHDDDGAIYCEGEGA